jgi:positive regulator of sigma E activity
MTMNITELMTWVFITVNTILYLPVTKISTATAIIAFVSNELSIIIYLLVILYMKKKSKRNEWNQFILIFSNSSHTRAKRENKILFYNLGL